MPGRGGEGVTGGKGDSLTSHRMQQMPPLHLAASSPLHFLALEATDLHVRLGDLTVLTKGDVPTLTLSLSVSSTRSTYVRRSMTEASALLGGATPLTISSDLLWSHLEIDIEIY